MSSGSSAEGGLLLYWAEHEELGFAPGVCVGENEEFMDLQICSDLQAAAGGETVVRIPKANAHPVHRNSLLGVPNLLELGDFNMPSLLHNVRVRYMNNEFYSSIGLPILISVNPYKSLPALYDQTTKLEYMKGGADASYSQNRKFLNAKPHLFATAQMTYSSLIRNKQAQSIVISGESGAGKTEATKILLKYFSELDSSNRVGPGNVMGDCIERYILNSNPILESFGNAKTVRNDNSSRFGRFIQIYFDLNDTHKIKCGRISHYLLEKCRLISLYEKKERNFHIFYQLALGGISNPYYHKKLLEWKVVKELEGGDPPRRSVVEDLVDNFKTILGGDPNVWYLGNECDLFEELISCMITIGLFQDEIDNILSIIAALMHLSTIRFVAIDSPDASYKDGMPLSKIVDLEPLRISSELLQINNIPSIIPSHIRDPVLAFSDILLFKVLRNVETAGGAPAWIRTPRDPEHAAHVRDSIIKEIYSRLFDWIIKRINRALMNRTASVSSAPHDEYPTAAGSLSANRPGFKWSTTAYRKGSIGSAFGGSGGSGSTSGLAGSSSGAGGGAATTATVPLNNRNATPPIGLLDIYGFEVFDGRNSFEQLCINYANEKLQQHFNQHVLSLEQATYRKEAIDWSDILFTDNRDIIRALEEPPHGIFVILDDTRITDKNRDSIFLQEIERRGIKPIVTLPARKGTTFTVKHYAGDVQYCAVGFVEKNVDKLEAQSSYFLSKASTKTLIKELFQPNDPNGFASGGAGDDLVLRRNSLKATLGVEFRNQLNQLISSLTSTTPTYVRCIKPNGLKQPDLFNSRDVLRQLEYAGLLESIRIRNSGFGVRATFTEFLDDYIIVLRKHYHSYRRLKQTYTPDQLKQLCVQLLVQAAGASSANTTGPRKWQIGRTKIFMKEEVQTVLEQARSYRRIQAAVVLQARVRQQLVRKKYLRQRKALIKVQALCKGHLARVFVRRYKAARKLQNFWRYTFPVRKWFVRLKSKCRFLQAWWRFHLYKRTLTQQRYMHKAVAAAPPPVPQPSAPVARQAAPPASAHPVAAPVYTAPAPDLHVSSMGTAEDFGVEQPASQPLKGFIAHPRPQPVLPHRRPPARKMESSDEELANTYAARRKSIHKTHEYNYEATIHLMFSELTSKLKKTEKENKKIRSELTKLTNELGARNEDLMQANKERVALEIEMEERDRTALAEIDGLVETIEALHTKIHNIRSLHHGLEAVLSDMSTFPGERQRSMPDCDLVRDLSAYVKGCCSRGFDILRSAMYQMPLEQDFLPGDGYSPRCRNTPPLFVPETSRAGQLSSRFSRVVEDELPPTNGPRSRQHFHRPRRNESYYDDSSSFGVEESARARPTPQQQRVVPYLRSTASAYKSRNPYLILGGKPLESQRSGTADVGGSQFDGERRIPYR